jgi:hypothetical protein
MLILLEGQTNEFGQAAGYVWVSGKSFYGTRVGPGWYQSGAGVARGCKVPFSVLRMLMKPSRERPQSCPQAGGKRRDPLSSWDLGG